MSAKRAICNLSSAATLGAAPTLASPHPQGAATQFARRVTGPLPRHAPEEGIRRFPESLPMQVVMGIDPGAANLGFGIVRVEGNHMVALDGGVVETTPELPMERRLERIHRALAELIAWHEPRAMAIEEVYFGKNVRSAMAVGQASGVAMLAAAEARRSTASPTRRRRSRWPSAAPAAPARARSSGWSGPCSGCPSRRPPTTPPTRSRWRSATAAAAATARRSRRPRPPGARAGSGSPDDRRGAGRGDGAARPTTSSSTPAASATGWPSPRRP